MLKMGKGVSAGIAIAPVFVIQRAKQTIEKQTAASANAEITRFETARNLAAHQLENLAVETESRLGKENSKLFKIHRIMLEDVDFEESVVRIIRNETVSAEYAVSKTSQQLTSIFFNLEDSYMRARAADIKDISQRVIAILTKNVHALCSLTQPSVLVSDDFSPSETAQLDRSLVKGIITTGGSPYSHSVIFARSMGIPAVIGIGGNFKKFETGNLCIMDGGTGEIALSPDEKMIELYTAKQNTMNAEKHGLDSFRGISGVTKSGHNIKVRANIGSLKGADLALENDAEGIGLFRSEFLFLENNDFPTEDAQFTVYKNVAEKMCGKQVSIRTLDIGADKQLPYLELPYEQNPALGLRGIRLCLAYPDIFRTQLKAIYRASAFGNVAVMLPMVTSLEEVQKAKAIISDVQKELASHSIPFNEKTPLGIIIETPAAAIISDLLAEEVDFFSIGTNDLAQYTMAIDRDNAEASDVTYKHHTALLRLISHVAQNALKKNVSVEICGELASDKTLTSFFAKTGIEALSVAPSLILDLRKHITEI